MDARPTRVVIITSEVEAGFEDRFSAWLTQNRVLRARQSASVSIAGAYLAVDGQPKFMCSIELAPHAENAAAVTEGLLDLPDDLRGHVSEQVAVYGQVFPADGFYHGVDWSRHGQEGGLLVYRMSVVPETEPAFNRWYNEAHIPALGAVPGNIGARRFRALEGRPLYMAWYELQAPDVPASKPWHDAVAATPSGLETSERWRTIYKPLATP